MEAWESDFNWSRTFISSVGSISLLVMSAVAPIVGYYLDKYGPRSILAVGLACISIGSALVAFMTEKWQFAVFFGIVSSIGFGIVAIHVVTTTIALTFKKKSGFIIGLTTSGATAGQLLLVPLLTYFADTSSWQRSYLYMAAIACACAVFVVALIPKTSAVTQRQPENAKPGQYRELLKSPIFHALFWSFAICGYGTTGIIETHLIPFARSCGFDAMTSSQAYGVLSAVNMAGMIIAGYLVDIYSGVILLTIIYVMRCLTYLLIQNIGQSGELLFVAAIVFGLFDYSTVPVTAHLVAEKLGTSIMGLAMGILSAGHAVGAALGAFTGGVLFDLYQSYDYMWLSGLGLTALAAGAVLLIPTSPRPSCA